MRQRQHATIRDWFEYIVLRTLHGLALALPWRVGRRFAGQLARVARVLDKRSRKVDMTRNIRAAFPDLPERRVRAIIKGAYRALFESLLDFVVLGRFAAGGRCGELFETEGTEKLRNIRDDVGIIFVTGHFGCWEAAGLAAAAVGYPVTSIARPRHNPLFESFLNKLRQSSGQSILPKWGSMRRAIEALKAGRNLAFLIDQDARRQGIFVDFLGRPASTVTSVARLAIYTGAPVVFAYAERIERQNRFRLVFKDVIRPRKGADKREELYRITQRFTRDLEELVRKWPEKWLWQHRRWKTYPGKYSNRAARRRAATAAGMRAGKGGADLTESRSNARAT